MHNYTLDFVHYFTLFNQKRYFSQGTESRRPLMHPEGTLMKEQAYIVPVGVGALDDPLHPIGKIIRS